MNPVQLLHCIDCGFEVQLIQQTLNWLGQSLTYLFDYQSIKNTITASGSDQILPSNFTLAPRKTFKLFYKVKKLALTHIWAAERV